MIQHKEAGRARELLVEDAMTRSVVFANATDSLRSATQLLLFHGIGGAPVELGGTVLGMVILMDLNRALTSSVGKPRWFRGYFRSMASGTVADVMRVDVPTVGAEAPLADVCDVMSRRSTDRVLVTDSGVVIGIVTATNVARSLASGIRPPAAFRKEKGAGGMKWVH